jgi:metal-responsive CopG/Arc/MetJ family transcriptional regulator
MDGQSLEGLEEHTLEVSEELAEAMDEYLREHPRWTRERLVREAIQRRMTEE